MSRHPLRPFVGTILVGAFATYIAVTDIVFTTRAVRGTATVLGTSNGGVRATPGRSGRTLAEVVVFVDGERTEATLRAWYRVYRIGESVPVLYLRSRPEELIPDEFWQAHFASVLGLAVFLVVTLGEWYAAGTKTRRPARSMLLGD